MGSVDGMTLSVVPQLANTIITKFTKASISIVWVYLFQKNIHHVLINARDLRLKKHYVFSINTTRW